MSKLALKGSCCVTLRFLCGWWSGWGLGPRFDGGPFVTLSGGWAFLYQPRRTQVVHGSTLVLQRGGREVCRGRKTISGIDQHNPAITMQCCADTVLQVNDLELRVFQGVILRPERGKRNCRASRVWCSRGLQKLQFDHTLWTLTEGFVLLRYCKLIPIVLFFA